MSLIPITAGLFGIFPRQQGYSVLSSKFNAQRGYMMKQVFFHIEVEDCLWDEVDNPPEGVEAQLETETIEYVSKLFGKPVSTEGRRPNDGALICSFKADNLDRVRKIIQDNLLTEGNDQIVSGAEYVIVRDFQTY